MLFNEPKLLKSLLTNSTTPVCACFSALQRAEIAEIIGCTAASPPSAACVSVLFNEPKLLKYDAVGNHHIPRDAVSVLFNEPKLLKCALGVQRALAPTRFQCSSTSRNC